MKFKPNLPLGIGLLLFSATQILSRFIDIPNLPHYALLLSALALELWGGILIARSPSMKDSKLRQWKLRLIGREANENGD